MTASAAWPGCGEGERGDGEVGDGARGSSGRAGLRLHAV